MKNKILSILEIIVVSSLFLSGCFSTQNSPDDLGEAARSTYTGVLKVQTGVYADLPGTHFLDIEGKEKLPLSSLNVNLSDSKYLNKQVEVQGAMKESSANEKFLDVEIIKVLGEAVSNGSWEIYKNTDLGVKIAYKNDWTINETEKDRVTFAKNNDATEDKVVIRREKSNKDSDLKTSAISIFGSKAEKAALSKVGTDSMDALKLSADSDRDIIYVLKRYEWVYTITFDGTDSTSLTDNKNVFHQMLLDFQFVGLSESAADSSPTTTVTESTLSDSYAKVLASLKQSTSSWSEDLTGNVKLVKAEFVDQNYVFAEFLKDNESIRYLFQYSLQGETPTGMSVVAKYKKGSTTDWELTDGSNPVLGKEKTLVNIKSDGSASVNTLKAGNRFFEAGKYGFSLQYPSAWYFAGSANTDAYRYSFSDKPVELDNELVSIDVIKSGDSPTSPQIVDLGDTVEVTIKGYKLKFSGSNTAILKEMANSVQSL